MNNEERSSKNVEGVRRISDVIVKELISWLNVRHVFVTKIMAVISANYFDSCKIYAKLFFIIKRIGAKVIRSNYEVLTKMRNLSGNKKEN